MNTDPANTSYPHLDLEELIAEAAGQPVDDRAREHLAGCEQCRLEANRWNLVADGVRGLAAAPETARPARPKHTRQRVLAGPWRRPLLAAGSVAAAFVLLVGIGGAAGLVHVSLPGHRSGTGTGPALTAVTGCTQLQQADGTLEQVNGSSLVVKTVSGQPVTVTTTASTFMTMSGPLPGDITDGASVMVHGNQSGATFQAAVVTVGQPFSAVNPAGFAVVQGTVADAGSAGFTLVTASGTRIPVTISGDTLVVLPHASPDQLQIGAAVFALGQPGPDGTLSATAVAGVVEFSSGPHIGVSLKGCSPSSIIAALDAISVAPISAG
jgi:hypothetical protein